MSEVECEECGWQGSGIYDLVDGNCPTCGSGRIVDCDNDDDETDD
jgi:predicted RNA-binding Zn-ribbon protein involved in translation (DUF1610 family)